MLIATAGPRAKRARAPRRVEVPDTDGAGSLLEISRLVRDLCRQVEHDRESWRDVVATLADHAQRIGRLDHETLQTNDQFSMLMDGHLNVQRAQEQQFREHIQAAVGDVSKAIRLTDESLRQHVDTGLTNSKILMTELTAKFQIMDVELNALKQNMAVTASAAAGAASAAAAVAAVPSVAPQRAPFLDPATGLHAGAAGAGPVPQGAPQPMGAQHQPVGAQHFSMATPAPAIPPS